MNGSFVSRGASVAPSLKYVSFALLAGLYLLRIGAGSLWDNSEPTYGEIVKELFRTGDWLTLHLNFAPWDTHPPLWFWTAGAFVGALGLNEFALRLPSAVFGLATAYVTYRAGKRLYGDAAGLIAALASGVSLEMIVLSRLAMMETMLIFFTTVATFWTYFAVRDADRRALWIAAVAAALGTLTKGPIAIALPLLIIVVWLAWTGRWSALTNVPIIGAAIAYMLLAGSWFAAATVKFGPAFLVDYFGTSNVGRYLHPFENQPGPVWYYVPVLLVGFFPFIAFVPQALRDAWRERGDDELFLLLFAVLPFVFFTIAQTKLPNYIAVMFPALGVLVGRALAPAIQSDDARRVRWAYISTVAVLGIILAAAAIAVPPHLSGELRALSPSLALLAVFTGLPCAIFALMAVVSPRAWFAPVGLITAMTGFIVALAFFVLPQIDALKPMKGMAERLMAARRDDESVCFDGVSGGFSLLFYTEAGPVTSVGTNPTDVLPARYFAGGRRALCVVAPSRFADLQRADIRLTPIARDPKMVLVAARR
ncbi:MAG TPA: glycosyltransferase family 39 protein [Candidatus Eremiobacteraceae bacterium]|nr:glycosyltransferase family 39 protein [Candidatus Eremiobacteraceae bacterium]